MAAHSAPIGEHCNINVEVFRERDNPPMNKSDRIDDLAYQLETTVKARHS